jgi:hypothetical protein
MQAELEALKQIAGNNILFDRNGSPVQIAPQNTEAAPVVDPMAFQKSLDEAWESDPRKAVEMTVSTALQWQDDINSQVDMQELETATKHADFDVYRTDVRKYVRTLPLDQRSRNGVMEMAYFVVKGQKSGNVYQTAQEEMLAKIRAGEQVAGLTPGTVATPRPTGGTALSEEQLRAAGAMGLTAEQYRSAIK